MTPKELAVRLALVGLAAHRTGKPYAVANSDPGLKDAGNAAVAAALELMGEHGIVLDVQPHFDATGTGFAYKVATPPSELTGDTAVARWVITALEPDASDTSQAVADLLQDCKATVGNRIYTDDLLESLRELGVCFDSGCHIACLALGGKILEIALKQLLIDHQIPFDDKWMIGRLLVVVRESGIPKYLDPSLRQVGEIINRSRIPAVHALENVPVPSREQAAMVVNAVLDTVRRTLVSR